MTTKEQKPQLVRQDANLLNSFTYIWSKDKRIMEFMGVEEERTFETMEYPDYERGVGFYTRKVWVPRPGPMKIYDKDNRLLSSGTMDYVKDDNGFTHLKYVGKLTRYIYNDQGQLDHREEAEFSQKGDYSKRVKLIDSDGKLFQDKKYYKNGNQQSWNSSTPNEGYWFSSKSGKVYYIHKNFPKDKQLILDNIESKYTDRKARRTALKKILAAREQGDLKKAQRIRHEFDEQTPRKTTSVMGWIVARCRKRKTTD